MRNDPRHCCIGTADGTWQSSRLSRQQTRLLQTLRDQPRQRAFIQPGRSSDALVTWETSGTEPADAAVWLELMAFGLVAGWSGWLVLTSGGHSLLHEHSERLFRRRRRVGQTARSQDAPSMTQPD